MNKVKVLLLIPRKKDNVAIATEQMQHRKCFRKIWHDKEEKEKRILELRAIAGMYPEYMWRIYETINWRDLRKTWYMWNQKMLDWQRSDPTGKMEWLNKVHPAWTSVMMTPQCKHKDRLKFLLDKDDFEDVDEFEKVLLSLKIEIVKRYNTPGGVHFLVKPFNPALLYREICNSDYKKDLVKEKRKESGVNLLKEIWNVELHRDGLQLVEVL